MAIFLIGSILLRRRNRLMNAVQQLTGLILHHGNASKEVMLE